jgi:hypothetical protein
LHRRDPECAQHKLTLLEALETLGPLDTSLGTYALAFHPLQLIGSSKNSHSIVESRSSDIMKGSCSRVFPASTIQVNQGRDFLYLLRILPQQFMVVKATTMQSSQSGAKAQGHVKEASTTKDYAATGRLLVAVGRHVTVRSQGLHGYVDGKLSPPRGCGWHSCRIGGLSNGGK